VGEKAPGSEQNGRHAAASQLVGDTLNQQAHRSWRDRCDFARTAAKRSPLTPLLFWRAGWREKAA